MCSIKRGSRGPEKSSREEGPKRKAYERMQDLTGLMRHKHRLEREKKELEEDYREMKKEGGEESEKSWLELVDEFDKKVSQSLEGYSEIEEKSMIDDLQNEIETIEKEIEEMDLSDEIEEIDIEGELKKWRDLEGINLSSLSGEEKENIKRRLYLRKLKTESFHRLKRYMRSRKQKRGWLREGKKLLREGMRLARKQSVSESGGLREEKILKLGDLERRLEEELEAVSQESPEAFIAHWLLKLREWKEQLPTGIVETAYPKEVKTKVKEALAGKRVAALMGETGTGKTRLARKVAEEMSREAKGEAVYEFVGGHAFMTSADLFSFLGMSVEDISPEEVPQRIEEVKQRYESKRGELTEEESSWLENVVQGQAMERGMETKRFTGPVLKAAEEGKIVIIDEFNYIKSDLLGGCNALIEAKPGEKVSVYDEEIEVKEGFGIIFTGNITRTEFKNRYTHREELGAALINRLNKGFIEYGSLPQADSVSFQNSIVEREDLEKEKVPDREMFQIALTILTGEKGDFSGLDGTLEETWRICSEFSLLQKLYAGEELDTDIKLPGGTPPIFEKFHVSNRTLRDVLEDWKADNFQYAPSWYIFDHLIRPADTAVPSEAGQMYELLKGRGFFREPCWDDLHTDRDAGFALRGIGKLKKKREELKKKLRRKGTTRYFSPGEVTEAVSGMESPSLKRGEEVDEMEEKEKVYRELFEKVRSMEKMLEGYEKSLEYFCEDERNIYEKENHPSS